MDEDPLECCRGECAKPLLARLQRAERVLALGEVVDECNRKGAVGDDHARRRDVERELRPVPSKAAGLVSVGETIAPSTLSDHPQDLGAVRGRNLLEERLAASLRGALVTEKA